MKRILIIPVLTCFFFIAQAQKNDRKIEFPDVDGYKTLKVDLHMHTVFSDGSVWPTIRVDEAVKDGLDAIAITEHIEYQPWKEDIPNPDRNRAYELAKKAALPHNLLVIPGAEITRKMPPGHANALFVTDVNELIIDDPVEAYKQANAQGAFVFWNHPHWIAQKKDALPVFTDMHKMLIKEKLLHGMEVVNDVTFSEEGVKIAQEAGLTLLGTSDIHGLVDYQYRLLEGGHRPVTLLLAKERSLESMKEALFAGRTIAWFDDILVGNEANMKLLLDACLEIKIGGYIGSSEVLEVTLTNNSDAKFFLKNTSIYDFHRNTEIIEIPAHGKKKLQVVTSRNKGAETPLSFDVLNAVVGFKQPYHLEITLTK